MTLFRRNRSVNLSEDVQLQEVDERHFIAQQVYFRRIAQGLTQEELADAAGTTQAQIANLEAGHVNPTLRTLVRVGHALGCNIRDLATPTNGDPESEQMREHLAMVKELLHKTFREMSDKERDPASAGEQTRITRARSGRGLAPGDAWASVVRATRPTNERAGKEFLLVNTDLALSA